MRICKGGLRFFFCARLSYLINCDKDKRGAYFKVNVRMIYYGASLLCY